MKKYFTILSAAAFAATLSAADFRIDINGINGTVMKPLEASEGVTLTQQSWRGKNKDRHLTCTAKVTNEWKKYSITFVAKNDGVFSMHLMSTSPKDFFACDDIASSQLEIKNGNFEQLNAKGEPESWYKMKEPRFSLTDGTDGSKCGIVAHNDRWHQQIRCKKGEVVTITFCARSIK